MFAILAFVLGLYLGYRFRDRLRNLKRTIWDDQVA
jgi:hypothetical protein